MNKGFRGKVKHGPFKIGMCNACHDSHKSENRKLLVGKVPDICFNCHSVEAFKGKKVHKPVADGKCFECHDVHTAPSQGLIKTAFNESCRKCHKNEYSRPHPTTLLPGKSSAVTHPMTEVENPRRDGQKMSCVSCHNPHSSDWGALFLYKAEKPIDLCNYCHR